MRDLYTTNTDRGRGGSKIPKIRLTSFVHGPLYPSTQWIDAHVEVLKRRKGETESQTQTVDDLVRLPSLLQICCCIGRRGEQRGKERRSLCLSACKRRVGPPTNHALPPLSPNRRPCGLKFRTGWCCYAGSWLSGFMKSRCNFTTFS